MVLADVHRGDNFKINDIDDERIRAQCLRFGIFSGEELTCGDKIPGGPVIIKRKFQELAVGRNLAKRISIIRI